METAPDPQKLERLRTLWSPKTGYREAMIARAPFFSSLILPAPVWRIAGVICNRFIVERGGQVPEMYTALYEYLTELAGTLQGRDFEAAPLRASECIIISSSISRTLRATPRAALENITDHPVGGGVHKARRVRI